MGERLAPWFEAVYIVLTPRFVLASQKIVQARYHLALIFFFIADNAPLLYHMNNRNIVKH